MKKHGIINRDIASALAAFGHTDLLVIGDCGLPIPKGVPCVDLSYRIGDPAFLTILDAVLDDFEAEAAFIAQEITKGNPEVENEILKKMKADYITHEELKDLSKQAKLIIRTGEATPYANIVLRSGVIF
ncbi:D-ribose pyranase [Microbacterium sp. APC 3898]|uniref:D-ribose pyranase n=2 Tax=Planococcus TaxID=1372 RepID=A0ABT7ZKK8_9BACL|nr:MULTISPECIES: D-ribose pyranase [Terrabacteria group]MBF6632743.1 D-ribose pyranase [Planococcus sp. (in: firmicutes)]MBD8014804.1 D-ribose pyranase [Planococcus wigleyi]MDN3427690.1 D-ribose pyranase [Planococcus sp. APC 4016]MDN3437045.1 D-ribose pyranase [Planococcus sp. APC 3900]MDN3499242.1 D-ribose pyranase [Microbacterium sp. APC 3898]